MLNENFRKAAASVKAIMAKGKGMWAALSAFAVEYQTNGAEALREQFKAQEKLANSEFKLEIQKNSTYKVAKGKLIKAVELGIPLVDAKGKPMGKTALEEAIKVAEGPKPTEPKVVLTPALEFAELVMAASKTADTLAVTDMTTACSMVSDLYKKLADRLPMPMAA